VVGRVQVAQNVGHGGEHGQPRAPAVLAVTGAEVDARRHDVGCGDVVVEQPEHRFGHDEGDALLQAVPQPAQEVPAPSRLRFDDDGDPLVGDVDGVGPDIVGPRVQRAARREVEAGVVPVAGHQAALDGPPVQRETQVRAPVVEGEGLTVAPEHADGLRPGLTREAARSTKVVERADRDPIAHDLPPVAVRRLAG
jgi:hypothetical protein